MNPDETLPVPLSRTVVANCRAWGTVTEAPADNSDPCWEEDDEQVNGLISLLGRAFSINITNLKLSELILSLGQASIAVL